MSRNVCGASERKGSEGGQAWQRPPSSGLQPTNGLQAVRKHNGGMGNCEDAVLS